MNRIFGEKKLSYSALLVFLVLTFVTSPGFAQWYNPGDWVNKAGEAISFDDVIVGLDDLGKSINNIGNTVDGMNVKLNGALDNTNVLKQVINGEEKLRFKHNDTQKQDRIFNNIDEVFAYVETLPQDPNVPRFFTFGSFQVPNPNYLPNFGTIEFVFEGGLEDSISNVKGSLAQINTLLNGLNTEIINQFNNDFNRTNAAFLDIRSLVEFHAQQQEQLFIARTDALSNTVNERGNFYTEAVKAFVSTQTAAIFNNINERGNFYAEAVKGHVNAQTNAILNIVDERGSFYADALKAHVNDQTGAILNIVDERVNFYSNTVKDQLNSQVAGLDQNLIAKAQGITQDISNVGNSLSQTISDKTEFIRGRVSEVQSKVSDFRTEVAGDFDILGSDVIQLLENLESLTGLVESQISMFGFLNFECTDAELEAVQNDYVDLFNNMQLTVTGLSEIAPTELPLDCAIPLGEVNLLLSGIDINLPSNKIVLQMLCNLNQIIDIPCVFEPIPATIEAIKQETAALEAALGDPVCREFPRTIDIIKAKVTLSALTGADSMVPEEMVNLKVAITVAKTLAEIAVKVFETLDEMNIECRQNQFRTSVQADLQTLLTDTPIQISQAQTAIIENNNHNTESIQINDNTNTAIIVSNDNANTESLSIQLDTTLNTLLNDNNVKRDEIVTNDNTNRDDIKDNDNLNAAMILTLIDENQIEEYLVNKDKKVAALVIPSSAGGKLDMVRELVWKRIQQFNDLNFKTKDADKLFNEGEKDYAKNDYKKAYENYMEAYQKLF